MHGGDTHRPERLEAETGSMGFGDFEVVSTIGRGARGAVCLIRTAEGGQLLALKAVSRLEVGADDGNSGGLGKEFRRIWSEKEMLGCFCHPLLPRLHGVVVTDRIVGFAIDYCPGRDLNYLRKKQTEKMFSDDIIRFYAAELVLGIEYLHGLGIVYRDLKPENVMIQGNGHLMLVDFDLSTRLSAKSPQVLPTAAHRAPKQQTKPKTPKAGCAPCFKRGDSEISPEYSVQLGVRSQSPSVEKSNSFVGTEEYVAPEIILGRGHDFSVDWWCLGVVLYEMLYGTTPFRGSNRKETFRRVISNPPDLTGELTPLRDLIARLLEKDPDKRISVTAIKDHAFFQTVDWDYITEIPRPPFIPEAVAIEDMGGNKIIDGESFVQELFSPKEGKMENKQKPGAEHDNFLVF